MSDANNNLGDLIDSSRQDAQAQQAKLDAQAGQPAAPARGKQILAAVLLAVFGLVLSYQMPRFSQPYAWPDAATNAGAAEGELMALVGWIETYRLSQGKLPDVLSEVAIPEGLAARMAETSVLYQPAGQAYTLVWTFPHWRASFDSQSENVVVEPLVKK